MGEISKRSELSPPLTADQLAEFVNKPLRQLPEEWRPVVWVFWSAWSHLLPTQLALASRLRQWIAGLGLTLDDARAAFTAVNQPDRMAGMRFASDLLAALAGEVGRIVKERDRAERERQRRERHAKDKADSDANPGPSFKDLIAGIGRPVE